MSTLHKLVGSTSIQMVSVDSPNGDRIVTRSTSIQSVEVDNALGSKVVLQSSAAMVAGYDISGIKIAIPDVKTNIIRVK